MFINLKKTGIYIYVIEHRTLYDPVKKYNKVLSSKILSKTPKGTDKPVPTRPKRRNGEKVSNSTPAPIAVEASRTKVGMMDIIDYIGAASGIDDAIYGNTDKGTAQKIISLARYLLATNGQSLPGIQTWQFSHPLTYEEGLSENVYHDLFAQIGRDESLQQNFFINRAAGIKDKAVLAYDSTTISTYSDNLPDARYGFNKASDGLPTIKVLTLYSIETRQPIAFTTQPGNLPDVVTIENALKQLAILGLGNSEIVTDNGYYSEQNLADMLHVHFDFITLSKVSIGWIKKELKAHHEEFKKTSGVCPYDANIHGITITLKHGFSYKRKYASKKKPSLEGYISISTLIRPNELKKILPLTMIFLG